MVTTLRITAHSHTHDNPVFGIDEVEDKHVEKRNPLFSDEDDYEKYDIS